MNKYHLRRQEKLIKDFSEILEVIRGQKYMTLAMCKDNEPYLVTLSYAYDEEKNCFYFHCANEGKKIDYLKKILWSGARF